MSKLKPCPESYLTDAEINEASRMHDTLAAQGDPYAVAKVVEFFLRKRRTTAADTAPDGYEVWSVAADGVHKCPMTIFDTFREAWDGGLEIVDEEYPTFAIVSVWRSKEGRGGQ